MSRMYRVAVDVNDLFRRSSAYALLLLSNGVMLYV